MNAPLASPVTATAPPVAALSCLIVNPRSFRASSGGLAARAVALGRQYGVEVIEASEPQALGAALDRLRGRGCPRLIVLSGDGTVQALVQYLALLPDGDWSPELLLLGGGRSNTIASDFNGRGAVLAKLENALRRCRDGGAFTLDERALLRVEQAPAPPQHGFFFAASMIDAGIRLCHEHRIGGRGWLRTGLLSTPWCLLKVGLQVLAGRSPLPPYPQLTIRTDEGETLQGPNRVLIATTLLHRAGLYNPYAARGAGPLRVTAVAVRAGRFWRRLPRLLTGTFSPDMNLQDGYLSGGCQRVEVLGLARYALDGERFDTDPARPVLLCAGRRLRLLRA